MRLIRTTTALLATLLLGVTVSGCYVRGTPGLIAAVAGTAIVTAAIVSASPPPPPRVVYVPAPRRGYAWQPGYWTRQGRGWVWVEGTWLATTPGYAWVPTHWERAPDGSWHLIRGYWACTGAEPC